MWKATECRLFLLYLGPVILEGVLPLTIYLNFRRLSLSIYLLSHPKFCREMCQPVGVDLSNFLREYEFLYGSEHLIYNIHSLKHLPQEVMEHGELERFSAFPFESYMSDIRSKVHCGVF